MSNVFQGPADQEYFGLKKTECRGHLTAELRPVNEHDSENVARMLAVVEHEIALKSLEND